MTLGVLATTSYITATFMVEAIAGVNAIKKRARELEKGDPETQDEVAEGDEDKHDRDEGVPLMVPSNVLNAMTGAFLYYREPNTCCRLVRCCLWL